MNTTNKQIKKILSLFHLSNVFLMLLSAFVSTGALAQEKIFATKFLGVTGGNINVTLANKTVLELEVPSNALKEDVKITLSESYVIPHDEDIISLLSIDIEKIDNIKMKKPFHVKAIPVKGIDQSRVEMIQAYVLKTRKDGKQYWSRIPFTINKKEGTINIFIEEPGTYKIQYSRLKVGNGGEGFFRLDEPNKPRGDADYGGDAKFSLYFTGTGDDVYFFIYDEFGTDLWDGSEDGDVTTITSSGWFQKTIGYSHFMNTHPDLAYLKDRGKFKVTCFDQDVDFDDELWTAYFIRDRDGINNIDETTVKELLNDYSPYVFYGDHRKSAQANTDPWGYTKKYWYVYEYKENEMSKGEIYYPIDIRELVTYFAPNFVADGITDFQIGVGNKIRVPNGLDVEDVLSNTNIVESTSDQGIDIASYNDSSYEYGMFREWSSSHYDLLEFEGLNDAPYVAGLDNNPSYPENTVNFNDLKDKSKIYGTAYEYENHIFLQYFFYYPFDPKTGKGTLNEWLSRHSGDRERFVVILKKDNNNILKPPVGAYFFHHLEDQVFAYCGEDKLDDTVPKKFLWNVGKTSPGAYVNWTYVEKTDGHPHIYVAQGSHGIYFRQGSYTVTINPTCWFEMEDALKEYAGGQNRQVYNVGSNLIYLPRLSKIDTISSKTEFSFLLFSGIAAQTENIEIPICKDPEKILFPPYDDVWYAVDKYCFNGTTFQPRNDITENLSIITIKPSISIVSPLNGSNLSGVVNVTASASPISNISKVEFCLDNALVFTDYTNPYSWSWDTTKDTNGSHNLTAKAIALAGDDMTTSIVSVTVNNTSGTGNNSPNIPNDLVQYKSDGVTGIAGGSSTNERTVVMKGKVTDPDNNPVSLEVEYKPIGTSFSNSPSPNCVSGGSVASGQIAVVTCSGLADGQYHWQARAKDSNGAVSNWLSAGGNSESSPDFIVSASSLKVGDWITATANLNVRETPGGNLITTKTAGSVGKIIDGPQDAYYEGKLYTWWKITWDDGITGWSIQDYLNQITNYPPIVTVISPNGDETMMVNTSYEIKWLATDSTGTIQRIDIYGSNDDGGSWFTIASNETNDGSSTWSPSTQTAQGRIKVEATDSFGSKGNDMSNGNFSVVSDCQTPSVPTLYSIAPYTNSYYVTWSAASSASYYNLQEDDSSSFSSPTVVYTNNGTSWYSGNKLPGTYYYRIKAINSCGESGWSNIQSVTIQTDQGPSEITVLNPVDGSMNQPLSLTLSWSASHAGGEGLRYNVYVAEGDTTIFYPNNLKSYEQTGTTYAISNLPYNTIISWGIEAIDDTGDRKFSSMFHFTTIGDSNAPTGSILINNGAVSTTSYSVTLNLSATDNGSGVRSMRLSNDGTHWTYWVPFSTQYSWNLADTNYGGQYGLATYTVYAKFNDYEDNESQPYLDTIAKAAGTPGQILLNGKVYQTIQDAINTANSGDTVYLTEGIYEFSGSVIPTNHSDRTCGIQMKPGVTLVGAGADKTTIDVRGYAFAALIDANNSVIEGVTIINSGSLGWRYVVLLESNSSKIKNCTIKGGDTGIHVGWGTSYTALNAEISNNLIINNRSPGIWLESGTNIFIYNNTIASNGSGGYGGIFGYVGSANIVNNIIANNGIGVNSYDSPSTFQNNDVYGNSSANYSGAITNQTGINGNISSEPSFKDTSNGDYSLNSGSLCINAGTNVGIPYDGSAPDIGAFEYNGAGTIQVMSNRADALFTIKGPSGTYTGSGTGWSLSNLPIGIYTITFTPITNLYSPPYQAKMLYSGQTLIFDGTYQEDTDGPTGTVSINFDEYATADKLVTLTFDLIDEVGGLGESSQMMFSNDGVTWSTTEPYSEIKKDWDATLFGGNATSGEKTVYAKVSDTLGNWSTLTDTIKYVPDRRVLEVPTQYSTIQSAIDAAVDGDMVYVYPGDYGVYQGSITLKEGIRLQGAGPLVTVFNAYMTINMARNSMIDGFSGYMHVDCANGPAIVSNNWIRRGVSAYGQADTIIRNNVISDHYYFIISGAVKVSIENNTFANMGTAILLDSATPETKVYLKNNIIANNNIGIIDSNTSDTIHQHIFPSFNIYWNNTKGNFGELDSYYSTANNFKIMGSGDMDSDPMFTDADNNDFHLKVGSPAINSGNPDVRYNDPDGTRNDRGCYGGTSLNTPPKADFSIEPARGGIGIIFTFDGSLSTDIESKGDQLSVRWDLDGDNNFDTPFSLNKKIVHQYDTEGDYNVTLEVQDKGGFILSTTKSVAVINQTPNVPSNPTPLDGATDQPRDIVLRWKGGDLDINDTVTYDVYFGITSEPPLISSDQPDTSLQPGVLLSTTTYYWKIVAKDNHDNTSIGPLWHFTTAYTDAIQPYGSISINNNETYTMSNAVTLNLYATDNIGITGYYVSENPSVPQASDTNWISTNSITNYIANIPYVLSSGDGNKTVYAWYKDAAGNVSGAATDSITLDTTTPTITITSPTTNSTYTTTSSTINLGGNASDSTSGLTSVTWSNNNGGEGTASGTASWSVFSISLSNGDNVITVTAKDGARNTGEDTITITYNPSPTPTPTPISDLQVFYKFDEGIGTVAGDSSGNGNDGTINGATWTAGKSGSGLGFDGVNDYVSVPQMNNDEISICAWFNKTANDTTRNDAIFSGFRNNSNLQQREGFELRFPSSASNTLEFVLVTQNGSGTKTTQTARRNLRNSVGSWYHAVGTYNQTTGQQRLYVNGELVNTVTHPAGNTVVPMTFYSDMRIGHSRVNAGYFNGVIDDVRLCSLPLTDQEIRTLYTAFTGDLQALYTLDEVSGTIANDTSGNGNHGGVTGGATWTTGQSGGGLSFDGVDDYVTIPRINNDEVSVCAWCYKNANDTTRNDAILGGFRNNSNVQLREGYELRFPSNNPDTLQFVLVTQDGSGVKTMRTAQSNLGNSVGSWYHAVGTYNKTTGQQRLYVNGQPVNTQTHAAGNTVVPLTSYTDMRMGHSRVNAGYFNGILDDVRIYKQALSDQEALDLYNSY